MRRAVTYAVTLATAAALVTGCDTSGPEQAAPAPSAPAPAASAPLPESPPPEPPPSNPAPTTPAGKLRTGSKGPEVLALQQSLTKLGYWNGRADGTFGSLTQQAVFALQKAAGLTRDGVVGPKTRKALDEGVRPRARSDGGRVVEIDKKRQLLMLVDDGEVTQTFNTSTGSYERYETTGGGTAVAATPDGKFKVYRQIDGWRNAPLGMLWRPKYFNGGIAVHGATSVPPYPASHGCARLSISAMNHLWGGDEIPLRTRVWVY
ncbi:L,D-transpeptidase family protein [Couchioplanes azureus]|uniref:L,D-transpeptidase family protein n=1 Tax=Couchioplanes caeruleus TaxID=56438 RepID=UPI001E58167A|nr:L,D-transpeptidase family protein [Couchioplanes caeruleus]